MFKKLFITTTFALAPMLALVSAPTIARAAGGGPRLEYFEGLLGSIYTILQQLTIILIGLAVVLFLWGLLTYLFTSSDEKKGQLKGYLFSGLIILFVMTTLWGIIYWLRQVLDIQAADAGSGPGIPRP